MSAHRVTTVDQLFKAQKEAKIKKLNAENAAAERAANPEATKQQDEDEAERAKLSAAIAKRKSNPFARRASRPVESSQSSVSSPAAVDVTLEVMQSTPPQEDTQPTPPTKKFKPTLPSDEPVVSKTVIADDARVCDDDEAMPSSSFYGLLRNLAPNAEDTQRTSSAPGRVRPVAPDVESMRKYNRRPGGEQVHAGLFFHATYENSRTIGKILATLAEFAEFYTLLFTDTGMEVLTQDDGKVWTFLMKIPASAFLCYNNLCDSAMMFVVMGSKMKRFAAACSAQKTLTFCRRQNGDENEPLDLMLFPLDGKEESGSVQRAQFKQYECDRKRIVPVDSYQFKIFMHSHVLAKHLKYLAAESPDIAMELSKTTFKLSAIDQELGGDQSVGFPVRNALRDVVEQPSSESCYVEKIVEPDKEQVTLANIPHMRFIAAYLVRMMQFECDAKLVELRIGVRDSPFVGEVNMKEESPLCVVYDYAASLPSHFQVKMWLAPEIEMN